MTSCNLGLYKKAFFKRQESRRAASVIKQTVLLSWTLHTDCKLSTLYSAVQGRQPNRLVMLSAVSFSDRLRLGGDGWDDNIVLKGNK